MIKVVVIGSGNVAVHFIKALGNAPQVQLVQAVARRPEELEGLLPYDNITADFNKISEADVYLISVTDGAIGEVSGQLPFAGKLVVHTSGSTGMEALNAKNRRGVFYPLQTFSKAKDVDFKTIPLCLEAENEADFATLKTLAEALTDSVYSISSAQRQALHVAAVFVSNFANHMYAQGAKVCEEHGIPFGILQPLIQETAAKIATLHPLQAQTGPAIRHDEKTIQKHMDFIKDDNQKAIYKLLTHSIQNTNE
jgi:predicted short-subunit dehydrogenase-like oxidoreductase (DUF2520 family)